MSKNGHVEIKPRRRRAIATDIKLDRLPPHSEEMERGVLGCILLSPTECLKQTIAIFKGLPVFYNLAHDLIYTTVLRMAANGEAVDVLAVHQRLKDNNELQDIGGIPYLNTLQDSVPSAANVTYYAEIVYEKFLLRRTIQICTSVVERAYDFQGEVSVLIDEVERDIRFAVDGKKPATSPRSTIKNLMEINLDDMSNTLIGNDWLEKGSSCLISAASGIGKSVLEIQMAVFFALGIPFMGLKPHRELKSVIIFAENSDRDNARALKGVLGQLGIVYELDESQIEKINHNVIFRECYSANGAAFVSVARNIAIEDRPDLMWLDPIAAYAGDDVGKQTVIAEFCRAGLHPIAKDFGFAWIIINHFTKPSGEKNKAIRGWNPSDQQYKGAGSYDLPGWARAGITISEHENGVFHMRFVKRGKLAGATHPNGEPTQTVWMRHSDTGIFWQQIDPPAEAEVTSQSPGGRPSKVDELLELGLGGVIDKLTETATKNELARRFEAFAASRSLDVSVGTCKKAVERLVSNKALIKVDNGYTKP